MQFKLSGLITSILWRIDLLKKEMMSGGVCLSARLEKTLVSTTWSDHHLTFSRLCWFKVVLFMWSGGTNKHPLKSDTLLIAVKTQYWYTSVSIQTPIDTWWEHSERKNIDLKFLWGLISTDLKLEKDLNSQRNHRQWASNDRSIGNSYCTNTILLWSEVIWGSTLQRNHVIVDLPLQFHSLYPIRNITHIGRWLYVTVEGLTLKRK